MRGTAISPVAVFNGAVAVPTAPIVILPEPVLLLAGPIDDGVNEGGDGRLKLLGDEGRRGRFDRLDKEESDVRPALPGPSGELDTTPAPKAKPDPVAPGSALVNRGEPEVLVVLPAPAKVFDLNGLRPGRRMAIGEDNKVVVGGAELPVPPVILEIEDEDEGNG